MKVVKPDQVENQEKGCKMFKKQKEKQMGR